MIIIMHNLATPVAPGWTVVINSEIITANRFLIFFFKDFTSISNLHLDQVCQIVIQLNMDSLEVGCSHEADD